jgi:hypothetical protein
MKEIGAWALIAASLPGSTLLTFAFSVGRQLWGNATVITAQSYIRFRPTPIVGP